MGQRGGGVFHKAPGRPALLLLAQVKGGVVKFRAGLLYEGEGGAVAPEENLAQSFKGWWVGLGRPPPPPHPPSPLPPVVLSC